MTDEHKSNGETLLIVLGPDESGKPRAARFSTAQADLVRKAAKLMGLTVSTAKAAELADLLKKLPTGRLYANGRGFVPNIRRDLYTKIAAALGLPDMATNEASSAVAPVELPPSLPTGWGEIDVGHMVIAQADQAGQGWWEAIVVEKDADMLTLKWRGFPTDPVIVRHCTAVALLKPVIATATD
jgi:hypothetical protein